MEKKRFYFIRHGQTDWNKQQLCQGHTDIPLNERGREEILSACSFIKQLPITKIYTSSLQRALDSAYLIQSVCKKEIQIVEEFRERYWGKLEGASSQEMYHIEMLEENNPAYNPESSIETRSLFKERFLVGLKKVFETEDALIVSHGRVFLVLCEILDIPLMRQIPNAAVIECEYINQSWKIKICN